MLFCIYKCFYKCLELKIAANNKNKNLDNNIHLGA